MTRDLDAVLPAARDELVEFLQQLAGSLETEPDRWANASLADFLRAWSAWLDDMDGYFLNRGEDIPLQPSWQLIGQMLLAARVYE